MDKFEEYLEQEMNGAKDYAELLAKEELSKGESDHMYQKTLKRFLEQQTRFDVYHDVLEKYRGFKKDLGCNFAISPIYNNPLAEYSDEELFNELERRL